MDKGSDYLHERNAEMVLNNTGDTMCLSPDEQLIRAISKANYNRYGASSFYSRV